MQNGATARLGPGCIAVACMRLFAAAFAPLPRQPSAAETRQAEHDNNHDRRNNQHGQQSHRTHCQQSARNSLQHRPDHRENGLD